MTESELVVLRDKAARVQGWIDYPTDSVEQGSMWHTDAEKAPFDHCFFKSYWTPESDERVALVLATVLRIRIDPRSATVVCDNWSIGRERHIDPCTEYYCEHGGSAVRATCLCILRCAAAIYDAQQRFTSLATRNGG